MLLHYFIIFYIKIACFSYVTSLDYHISESIGTESGPNLTLVEIVSDKDPNISKQFIHQVSPAIQNTSHSTIKLPRSKNYASAECAKVVETNPEAKKASHIINEKIDDYMLNPCKTKIWFVIELCETIQATHIELANYELFSSMPKDFTVYFSDTYPASDWKLVGKFTAIDSRTLQAFDLNKVGFGKFIRVEIHTHYGNEHYCPISIVKVYGASMVDEYEETKDPVDSDLSEKKSIKLKKSRSLTSAYRVYFRMMTEAPKCELSHSKITKIVKNDLPMLGPARSDQEKLPKNTVLPQPTQQPVLNQTKPLKPSIFVELSNKVKALETTIKLQKEDFERRLNETKLATEVKFEKFTQEINSISRRALALILSYLVYETHLNLIL